MHFIFNNRLKLCKMSFKVGNALFAKLDAMQFDNCLKTNIAHFGANPTFFLSILPWNSNRS